MGGPLRERAQAPAPLRNKLAILNRTHPRIYRLTRDRVGAQGFAPADRTRFPTRDRPGIYRLTRHGTGRRPLRPYGRVVNQLTKNYP